MPGETLLALYKEARSSLPGGFEADQLFRFVTGLRRHDLPARGGEAALPEWSVRLRELCGRRAGGEPLQYLLGEWEFYGLPFAVGPGVLIPRADTETLVELALDLIRDKPAPEILDLCSGSGCVAAALAKHLPRARVTAVELSCEALGYLEKNIARNRVHVRAVQADVRDYVHPAPADLISVNPPYIPRAELAGLQSEVRREPRMALDGGEDGLDFYRLLAARFAVQLSPGGVLCVEVGAGQSGDVGEIFAQAGLAPAGTRTDLGGVERAVAVRRPAG